MSSENELRAAAERRRSQQERGLPTDCAEADLIADAYLESQRREAEEGARPVDEAFVKSLGGDYCRITKRTCVKCRCCLVNVDVDGEVTTVTRQGTFKGLLPPGSKQGEILKLLAALGVAAKGGG